MKNWGHITFEAAVGMIISGLIRGFAARSAVRLCLTGFALKPLSAATPPPWCLDNFPRLCRFAVR
jgi:hypothetical protein